MISTSRMILDGCRLLALGLAVGSGYVAAHEGPDPIAHWAFTRRSTSEGVCIARIGPNLRVPVTATITTDPLGDSLDLIAGDGPALVTEP